VGGVVRRRRHQKDGQRAARQKRRPTYGLDAMEALGSVEPLVITITAPRDAAALGFDRHGAAAAIASMGRGMCVKWMTTFANHRVRQDHPTRAYRRSICIGPHLQSDTTSPNASSALVSDWSVAATTTAEPVGGIG
jgi:hypothetical protein